MKTIVRHKSGKGQPYRKHFNQYRNFIDKFYVKRQLTAISYQKKIINRYKYTKFGGIRK